MIRAVLFDLDGVLRHFDPAHVDEIETRRGLPVGSIHRAAFEPQLLSQVTTGTITRAEWTSRVGQLIADADAAAEWASHPAASDQSMLALSDELRGLGIRTAILTNGTDSIADELRDSGIAEHVDAVFNSADIGYAKPDVRAFQHVLDALQFSAHEVLFVDDSVSKLTGAAQLGIATHLFTGIDDLRLALTAVTFST